MAIKSLDFLFKNGNNNELKIRHLFNKIGDFKYEISNEGELTNKQIKFLLQKIDYENTKKLESLENDNSLFKIHNDNIKTNIDISEEFIKYKNKILTLPTKVNIHEILKYEYIPRKRIFNNNNNLNYNKRNEKEGFLNPIQYINNNYKKNNNDKDNNNNNNYNNYWRKPYLERRKSYDNSNSFANSFYDNRNYFENYQNKRKFNNNSINKYSRYNNLRNTYY